MTTDILDLLRDIREEVTDGAMTTEDLAVGAGISTAMARKRIKILLAEGKIARVSILRENLMGTVQPRPAWVVVGESE